MTDWLIKTGTYELSPSIDLVINFYGPNHISIFIMMMHATQRNWQSQKMLDNNKIYSIIDGAAYDIKKDVTAAFEEKLSCCLLHIFILFFLINEILRVQKHKSQGASYQPAKWSYELLVMAALKQNCYFIWFLHGSATFIISGNLSYCGNFPQV